MKTNTCLLNILLALSLISFVGCESDDDEVVQEFAEAVSIYGTWTGTSGSEQKDTELVLQTVEGDDSGEQVEGELAWGEDRRVVVGSFRDGELYLLLEGGDEWNLDLAVDALIGTGDKWGGSNYPVALSKTDAVPERLDVTPVYAAHADGSNGGGYHFDIEWFGVPEESGGLVSLSMSILIEQDGYAFDIYEVSSGRIVGSGNYEDFRNVPIEGHGTILGSTLAFSIEWESETYYFTGSIQGERDYTISGRWIDEHGNAGLWTGHRWLDGS